MELNLTKVTQVRLSQKGLDFLYKYNPKGRERARQWVFEFRGFKKGEQDIVRVKKNKGNQYYHISFLEPV